MSENGFRLEASDWEKSCFENGSCLPAEFRRVTTSLAQRVQGAVLGTLGWHSVFQDLLLGCNPFILQGFVFKFFSKQVVPPQSANKGAPKPSCAALKWHKSRSQNRLCRSEVEEKQLPKRALPPSWGWYS